MKRPSKCSRSTDRYTRFKNFPIEGKYNSAIALTPEEARRLVEDGWQYVCDIDHHPYSGRQSENDIYSSKNLQF